MPGSISRISALLLMMLLGACGGDSRVADNDVVVDPEPVVRNLEGRAVKGVIRHGVVEAHEYSGGNWQLLSVGFTDADGFFDIDLTGVTNPVRITVVADANTVILCDALPGCGEVAFGGETLPPENFRLVTILPSDYAGEGIAVTPLTYLAAHWIESMPAGLPVTDALINMANARVADLFGLGPDFIGDLPLDLTDEAELDGAGAMLHSVLAASFSGVAYANGADLQMLLDLYADEFADLAGQLVVATDFNSMRPGLDLIQQVANGLLQALVDESSREALLASVDDLIARWGENPLTTAGGAFAYDQQAFDDAMVLLDDLDYYLHQAGIDESASFLATQMDQLNWLYNDDISRADTVGLVRVMTESIAFAVFGTLSEAMIAGLTPEEQAALGNCIDMSSLPEMAALALPEGYATYCRNEQILTVTGERHGQQVEVVMELPALALDAPMQFALRGLEIGSAASVSNATAVGELEGELTVSITGFSLDQPVSITDIAVTVQIQGSGSIFRVSSQEGHPVAAGDGFSGFLQAGGELNLGAVVNGGTLLSLSVQDGELTSPFGDALWALDSAFCQGRPPLLVEIGELSSLSACFAFDAFGLPEMQVTAGGELSGLYELIEQLLSGAEGGSGDLASLIGGLDPSVLSLLGNATLKVLDDQRGERSYAFALNNNRVDASLVGTESGLSFYVTSLNGGYIISGSTLVATVNAEWQSLGATLLLANGERRSYLLGPISDVADDDLMALLPGVLDALLDTFTGVNL
ncbi:MAG: hypothetical protein KAG82_06245 [Alcanivoracaceae bacterium]|nr:hypothetical protein [Alcanivoracaceae bacterium]